MESGVLQSPYGAFCLRLKIKRGRSSDAGWVGCNPLTGLFVCDEELPKLEAALAAIMLQSPYGAFCLRQGGLAKPELGAGICCNPFTGLFVCDSIPR